MKINTIKKGDATRLIFFKTKYSRYARVFQVNLIDNKPKLSGYIYGYGGHCGSIDLSKPKLWSYFLRELKDAALKDELEFVD